MKCRFSECDEHAVGGLVKEHVDEIDIGKFRGVLVCRQHGEELEKLHKVEFPKEEMMFVEFKRMTSRGIDVLPAGWKDR